MNEWIPHGHAFAWYPPVLFGTVVGNLSIGIAYMVIPAWLAYSLRKRPGLFPGHFAACFLSFIFCCGVGHFLIVWNLWHAWYGVQALWDMVTGIVSIGTAAGLVMMSQHLIGIPTIAEFKALTASREEAEARRAKAEARYAEMEAELETLRTQIETIE